jgi:hypothetical protein
MDLEAFPASSPKERMGYSLGQSERSMKLTTPAYSPDVLV